MIDLLSLRAAFAGHLLTEPSDVAPFVIDWRNTWRGTALAVAQPECVEDVASVVKWCAANGVSVVPQGGNTSQSGGSVPAETGQNIVLSLTRLNTIRAVDSVNNTVTVDAGCILQTVQEAAAAVDRFFPLSLGAEGSCTIGGNLATNAGGTAVLRYGNMRDLCLGLEVVTASGEIWSGLRGLRKDNSGYDLRNLFVGSEGTLGVITGAVLRLFPKPATRLTAFLSVKAPREALILFEEVRRKYDTALTGFELMSDFCLDLVLKHNPNARRPIESRSPWYVLIEFTDMHSEDANRVALQDALERGFERGLVQDATVGQSMAQCDALWALREAISASQGNEGKAIKHDIAVPISGVADFIDEALAAVAQIYPDFRPVIFGHLGDGNLHFNFSSAAGADQAAFIAEQARLNRIVHDIVRAHHGTISAEHGLGVLRRDEADAFRSPVEKRLMASIKAALDPAGIMNPGKMLA
jgi:FAD/FMN-containing dehydrogenase